MLNGAIIGIGKIAQTGHLPAFDDESLRESARIIAAADASTESRRKAAERFPRLRLYSNVEEMLKKEQLDFVDICSPPHTHAEMIETACRAGLHIVCEKPLATSLQDAIRLADSLAHAPDPVTFMPCHQYRYAGLWRQFRSFIQDHGSGLNCQAQFEVYRTEPDPGFSPGSGIWRLDAGVSGGGILADTGVHYLYLTRWMLGMPLTITARTHRFGLPGPGVEDTATAILEGGCWEARLHLTWAADRRANRASVVCATGSIMYDGETITESTGEKCRTIMASNVSDKATYIAQYVSLFSAFVKKIHGGGEPAPDIAEARDAVRLLRACYASAASGETVTVENIR